MKNFLAISLGIFMATTAMAQAKEGRRYVGPFTLNRTVLSIQPLSLVVGGGEMAIEHLYADKKSIRLQLGYFLRSDFDLYNADFEGFRAEMQWRFYLSDDPAKGNFNDLYVAPYLQYKQVELTNIPTFGTPPFRSTMASAGGVGLLLGYQLMLPKNITIDAFAGGGLVNTLIDRGVNEVHIPFVNPYKSGIIIRFGFAVGLAI